MNEPTPSEPEPAVPPAAIEPALAVNIRGRRVPLVLRPHARQRQSERLVSLDDVIAAIEYPSRRGLPTQPGRKRVARTERGREVHVVYEEADDGTITVITTFRSP